MDTTSVLIKVCGQVGCGSVPFGMARSGRVWLGLVVCGAVWYGFNFLISGEVG